MVNVIQPIQVNPQNLDISKFPFRQNVITKKNVEIVVATSLLNLGKAVLSLNDSEKFYVLNQTTKDVLWKEHNLPNLTELGKLEDFSETIDKKEKTKIYIILQNTILVEKLDLGEKYPYNHKTYLILTHMALFEDFLGFTDSERNQLCMPLSPRKSIIQANWQKVYSHFTEMRITPKTLYQTFAKLSKRYDTLNLDAKMQRNPSVQDQEFCLGFRRLKPKLTRILDVYCIYYYRGLKKKLVLNALIRSLAKRDKNTLFPDSFFISRFFKEDVELEIGKFLEKEQEKLVLRQQLKK